MKKKKIKKKKNDMAGYIVAGNRHEAIGLAPNLWKAQN